MIQREIWISVELPAKFSHVVEPNLDAVRRRGRRTFDSALDTLSQLQVSHQRTVEREEFEDRFPNEGGAVRLVGINVNEEVADVREI